MKMNPDIHEKNTGSHLLHRLTRDAGVRWQVLATFQAVLSIWLVQATQHNPSLTLLAVIVWGGAAICIEDQLDELKLLPSRASFVAGFLLLLLVTLRATLVLDKERIVLIMPLVQGIALALMLRPMRQLPKLFQPLVVLSLFPLQELAMRLLPDYWMSMVTARLTQAYLLVIGFNASASGRMVFVGGRGVEILGECNSVDLMAQLTAIAIVFALAFPIRSRALRFGFITMAPVLGVVVNAGRIGVLAVLNSDTVGYGRKLFVFLHDEWGSLVFAGIATMILGQIYMMLIEHQLERGNG
jgi:exosortase/archaeosortase family protein